MNRPPPRRPIRFGFIACDGVQTIDLLGPIDALASASTLAPGPCAVTIVTPGGGPAVSETGVVLKPGRALAALGPVDTLVVPGARASDGPRPRRRSPPNCDGARRART